MARVIPGGDCRGIDIGPVKIDRDRSGAINVPDRMAKAIAQAVGGFVAGTYVGGTGPSEPNGPWCEHGERPYYCQSGCNDEEE